MRLLVAADSSMYKTPDGKYWSPTIYDYSFFERYLSVFEEVVVASRVKNAAYSEVEGFLRCDGANVTIAELPDMHGTADYLKKLLPFSKAAKQATRSVDCALIRVPSVSASLVLHYFKKTKKKFFLEVVVDPETAFAYHRPSQILFTRLLKKQCASADGVSYVTKEYLQSKYPSYIRKHGDDGRHFESHYSTIRLKEEYYGTPKKYASKTDFVIIHTANNINNYDKGHKTLLLAAKKVIEAGCDIRIRFVGDGSLRKEFEELAASLQIADRVVFTGQLSKSAEVRTELIRSDLFVFPTRSEGLPRSVIEAMAVGLPCISTPVAGIPELLEKEDMLDPDDADLFARRITELLGDPKRMEEKSIRNIEKAKEYADSVLSKRRNAFYQQLRSLAEADHPLK